MKNISLFIIFIIFIHLPMSIFILKEGNIGIVYRFGKILYKNNKILIYKPGIHIKIPYIETLKIIDSRIKTTENKFTNIINVEKINLIINLYVKWKIDDYNLYFLSTEGNIYRLESILNKQINNLLRLKIKKLSIKDIINFSDKLLINLKNILNYKKDNYLNKKISINFKENEIINFYKNKPYYSYNLSSLGIKIIDIKIKQIIFPDEIYKSIYKKMISEYKMISDFNILKGKEEYLKLKLLADRKYTKIISESKKRSLIIKGEADSYVLKLLLESFKKDYEFYIFIKNLHVYKNSFNKKNNIIILNTKNNFFKFMRN